MPCPALQTQSQPNIPCGAFRFALWSAGKYGHPAETLNDLTNESLWYYQRMGVLRKFGDGTPNAIPILFWPSRTRCQRHYENGSLNSHHRPTDCYHCLVLAASMRSQPPRHSMSASLPSRHSLVARPLKMRRQ
jgi:hypothetical protein